MSENSVSAPSGQGYLGTPIHKHETRLVKAILSLVTAIALRTAKSFAFSPAAGSRKKRSALPDLNRHLLRDIGLEQADTRSAQKLPEWNDPLDMESRRLR